MNKLRMKPTKQKFTKKASENLTKLYRRMCHHAIFFVVT